MRSARTGALAALGFAVVVVAALLAVAMNQLPPSLPTGTVAPGSPTPGQPTGAPTAFPEAIFGIDVLTVPDAIEVRDAGGAQEIAVAGWYQQPGPLFCPNVPETPVRPLQGDCSIDFTWLMADPEALIHVTATASSVMSEGGAPAGPAIHPVFETVGDGWANPLPDRGASTPTAVVLLGHFNDPRSVNCKVESRQACRERFVVDQVPWLNGAAHDAVFPAEIDGIPSWTVEETLSARDAGQLQGVAVAVAGWYSEERLRRSCAAPLERYGYLERYCPGGPTLIADVPQEAHLAAPPIGTALDPVFSPFWGSGIGPIGRAPLPVVLIGHFDDPLAADCRPVAIATCADVFVVDRVGWFDGDARGTRIWPLDPSTGAAQQLSLAEVEGVVREQLDAGAILLSVTIIQARDVATLDPSTDLDPEGLGVVWYVRAAENGTHRIGTFIVLDGTGDLRWSAFPLPAIHAP